MTAQPELHGSLMDPAVASCPWDFYQELHAHCPVYRQPETGMWFITKYDDIKAALNDTETFSSKSSAMEGLQAERARLRQRMLAERGWTHAPTLHGTDPPLHTRYRQMLNRVFSQRTVRELVPHIEAVTHSLIDAFADRGECEFFSEFAVLLPGTIIAEQLGLDRSQVRMFKEWGDAMLRPASTVLSDEELVRCVELELECQHHLARGFEERRANPRGDIMSLLVHAHEEQGDEPLTMNELQSLMYQFVTGGFETITSGLAHGMWLLLRHPAQMDELRRDPDLVRAFVEESVRIESPVQGQNRRTTRDVVVNGTTIPAGSIVVLRFGAANHDASEFQAPDTFDIHRSNAVNHLGFGGGPHYCIGAPLARQELAIAFRILLERLDDIELARPLPDPVHHHSLFYLHMKELPLRFRARRRSTW